MAHGYGAVEGPIQGFVGDGVHEANSQAGSASAEDDFCRRLDEARAGAQQSLGHLLQQYHDYLVCCARREIQGPLRARVTASDLVQETLLEAQRDIVAFRGRTPGELLAWLRRMLQWNAQNAARHHHQAKRQVAREVRLDSSQVTPVAMAGREPTASAQAMKRERDEELEAAIERLPARYRDVIVLRYREHLGFAEIARRLCISENAARKLWARGVERLKAELKF